MATYISNQTGNWNTASTWLTAADGVTIPNAPAGSAPQSGARDRFIIRNPHTVTYNTSGVFGDGGNGNVAGTTTQNILNASLILSGGRLRASRTQNTALTAVGLIWVDTLNGSFLDWGTLNDPVSAFTTSLSLSSYSSAGITVRGGSTTTILNSACFCGLEKTRNTFLTLSAAFNANTITVDNAFNWKVGDELVIESDTFVTSRVLSGVRIQNVNDKTITISPNLNFARLSGTRVGNFTSTVLLETIPSSELTFGIHLIGAPNAIYQFSDMTVKDFGQFWKDSASLSRNITTSTGGAISYDATYNIINPTFRRIAYFQTRLPATAYGALFVFNPGSQENLFEDLAYFSGPISSNVVGIRTANQSILRFDRYVCYRAQNPIYPAGHFKLTLNNSFLNSEGAIIGYTNNSGVGTNTIFNNCRLRSNTTLSVLDNLVNAEYTSCDITNNPLVELFSPAANAFGASTLNNCNLSSPLSSILQGTNKTLKIADVNIFNPNNINTFTNFNTYHFAESNRLIRKNSITSLSFTPKISNESFEKVFTTPAIQGVTQKIKGNLRFDSTYGSGNPPSITFGGAVNTTIFTCPAIPNTWHSFEYDLNPNLTSNIEIKVTGQSANINGFVYLDGLILDPFIKDARWYGFQVDKNIYRTVDTSTTLTENQVSAYPYINNLDLVYDEARYWTVTNPTSSSYIDLVNSLGKSLDFSPKGILLNSTALSSINYNPTTNLITLSTFNLSAGNNFDEIQTTGGITINDNSNISNITLVGSVSGTTARDLNGVIIDGTLTYNTNATTVITYTNCNIKKVENNGSGVITLNRLNTVVDEAGRNVVLLENPTYINISNLNGGYVAIFDNTATLRYYRNTNGQIILPNGSTGTWTYKVGRFQSRLITGSFSVGGTVNITPSYVQDLNVFETDVTVASAYNTFRNTQQVYDYFSYYMTTSAALSYPQFYNYRPILDITDKNLILNPSASVPFAYNGTDFTIKSQNLENGSIVKGVETTGNIYLSGSASLSAINIISDKINSESVLSLNSVNAASNIVYNTGDPFEIVYTNCIIDKVENLGSGDIRIKKINSTITDGTDAQISDYYPTYLNLSLNGGTIAIYDDSTTRQYFLDQNQTVELPYVANGTWTYRVTRYGQRTVESNFTVDRVVGGIVNITPTFQPDINVFGTLAAVSAYNTFSSVQGIYDYMSYYKTTNTGINYGDLTNVGSILDIGSRSLKVDILAPQLFSVDSNSISVSSNFLSAGDGSSVNTLKTTSFVYLSGDSSIRNITIQGSVYQNQVLSLTGVNVNNTILYKTDAPTSIIYTNCTVGSVVNLGGGMITITRLNSIITDESDAEVETVVPISINVTVDSSTYFAIYRPDGTRYRYGNGNTTYILGGDAVTGNWSYKVAKYGYELFSGTFLINKDISSVTNIAPTLVIDSSITITNVSTVSAYTDLNSTRKIYDYLSYYKTTTEGIEFGTLATRAIGSIILTKGLTLSGTALSAASVASDILTVKSSGLNEEITIYTSGDFTNDVNISDNVQIRATNIDSELELVGIDKLTLYSSSANRDSDTNRGPEITSAIYRFKYGSTVGGGVLLQGTQYGRVVISSSTLLNTFELNAGNNILNLGTFGQIQQVLSNQIVINDGVKKASRLIPHSTDL